MNNIKLIIVVLLSSIMLFSQELHATDNDFGNEIIIDSLFSITPHSNYYSISFQLDTVSVNQIVIDTLDNQYVLFSFPGIDYCDIVNEEGRPVLPTKLLMLQIPDSMYEGDIELLDFQVEYIDYSVNKLYLPYQPIPNYQEEDVDIEDRGFCLDSVYYSTHTSSLENYIQISKPFKAFSTTGFSININPIQYDPVRGIVRIIKSLNFNIPINSPFLPSIPNDQLVDGRTIYDVALANWMLPPDFQPNLGKILIITGNQFIDALSKYVNYRVSNGYTVDVVTLDYIKDFFNTTHLDPEVVRTFIRSRYLFSDVTPKYLILVGDENIIPYSKGTPNELFDPLTDLYYGCLEEADLKDEDDLFPELAYGRWPVTTEAQVSNIIDKIIDYDKNIKSINKSTLKSFLVSGIDRPVQYPCFDALAYRLIQKVNNHLQNNGFSNTSIYKGVDYENKTSSLQDSLKSAMLNNLWMFVYSGHGNNYSLGKPLNLDYSSLNDFSYVDIPPIAFSFACLTHYQNPSYSSTFGKQWVRKYQNSGGVAHYGSVCISYTDENEYLASTIFKKLSFENISIGRWIQNGAGLYFKSAKVSRRRRQVEKYGLFGDPSQYIFGTPQVILYSTPRQQSADISVLYFENQLSLDGCKTDDIVYIYDSIGKLIFQYQVVNDNRIDISFLPVGIYFAVVSNNKGITHYKFVVSH